MHPIDTHFRIDSITYNNTGFGAAGETFNLNPTLGRNIKREEGKPAVVTLTFDITSTAENPLPLEMHVSMVGEFDTNALEPDDVDRFLKIESVRAMLPYVRAIVTSVSACAMISPIIIPMTDVEALFPEDNNA